MVEVPVAETLDGTGRILLILPIPPPLPTLLLSILFAEECFPLVTLPPLTLVPLCVLVVPARRLGFKAEEEGVSGWFREGRSPGASSVEDAVAVSLDVSFMIFDSVDCLFSLFRGFVFFKKKSTVPY